VHTLAIQLSPVLAAEKSKTAYYIAGGALVAWALIVSLGLGLRKPDFPGSLGGQRVVMAISALLVLAAVSTAVITSGLPAAKGESGALASESAAKQGKSSAPAPSTSSPGEAPTGEESTGTTGTGPTSGKPRAPKATTGTPAPPSSPAAATKLKLAANPAGQLSYDTKQLSAKAGKVTIEMTNMSPIEHNVTVAEGSKVLGATPTFVGGTRTLTLTLKPGKYTFFCSVPGHRQAGMEGTLSVS
jgi:plastocyanin